MGQRDDSSEAELHPRFGLSKPLLGIPQDPTPHQAEGRWAAGKPLSIWGLTHTHTHVFWLQLTPGLVNVFTFTIISTN